jgi:hypothetical protein
MPSILQSKKSSSVKDGISSAARTDAPGADNKINIIDARNAVNLIFRLLIQCSSVAWSKGFINLKQPFLA